MREEEIKKAVLAVLNKMTESEKKEVNKRFVEAIYSDDYTMILDDIAEYVAYDGDTLHVREFEEIAKRYREGA